MSSKCHNRVLDKEDYDSCSSVFWYYMLSTPGDYPIGGVPKGPTKVSMYLRLVNVSHLRRKSIQNRVIITMKQLELVRSILTGAILGLLSHTSLIPWSCILLYVAYIWGKQGEDLVINRFLPNLGLMIGFSSFVQWSFSKPRSISRAMKVKAKIQWIHTEK